MRKAIVTLLLGFGLGLVVLLAQRTHTDAGAVIIGVAVGIIASVPTSLLLVALLRRRQRSTDAALTPRTPAKEVQP